MDKLNLDDSDTDISQFTAYSPLDLLLLQKVNPMEKNHNFVATNSEPFQDSVDFGIKL